MEKFAHIPQIDGVVFSDPWYGPETWCQYRKAFSESNWLLRMESKLDPEYNFTEFTLYLGRPTMMSATKLKENKKSDLMLSSLAIYDTKEYEIGMDTAQIFCGSMRNFEQFGESIALHTGSDGFFGGLIVLTCKGEDNPAGFVLRGGIDAMFADSEELFRHMVSGFDGQEISKEVYAQKTDLSSLENKVLFSNELRIAAQHEKAQLENTGKSGPDEPTR